MKETFEFLSKYKIHGNYSFKTYESLEAKCNAPTNMSGVYLIFKVLNSCASLIYIGSSGQKKDGQLKTRKSGLGGMKDRLVNGYHPKFGKIKRKVSFPKQMKIEGIPKLKIYWWVTYFNENKDFPTDIENILKECYKRKFGELPEWHK